MSELNPCPFCGGIAKLYGGEHPTHYLVRVVCTVCESANRNSRTFTEAIAAWNNRPIEDELRKLHERAKERIGKLVGA